MDILSTDKTEVNDIRDELLEDLEDIAWASDTWNSSLSGDAETLPYVLKADGKFVPAIYVSSGGGETSSNQGDPVESLDDAKNRACELSADFEEMGFKP